MLRTRRRLGFTLGLVLMAKAASSQQLAELADCLTGIERQFDVTIAYDADLVVGLPHADTTYASLSSFAQHLAELGAFRLEELQTGRWALVPVVAGANYRIELEVSRAQGEALLDAVLTDAYGGPVAKSEGGRITAYLKFTAEANYFLSSDGHKTVALPPLGVPWPKKLYMVEAVVELEPIIVTAYLSGGVDYNLSDQSLIIKPTQAQPLPGQLHGDVMSAVEALPGVSLIDGKPSSFNLRGSSTDQTLLSFNGIPLFNKGHIFGAVSQLTPLPIEKVMVQRGAMSVADGGRAGGIIEMSAGTQLADSLSGAVAANMLDAAATLSVPIIKNHASITVAARQSFPYSLGLPAMRSIHSFVFQFTEIGATENERVARLDDLNMLYNDATLSLTIDPTPKHRLQFSALRTTDGFSAAVDHHSLGLGSTFEIENKGLGFSANYSANWGKKWSTEAQLSQSFFKEDSGEETTDYATGSITGSKLSANVGDARALLSATWQAANRQWLQFGYDGHSLSSNYNRLSTDSSDASYSYRFDEQLLVSTLFGSWRWQGRTFYAMAGLRATSLHSIASPQIEPRLMASRSLGHHWKLKASAARHIQYVIQVGGISLESLSGVESNLWLLANGGAIPVLTADQLTAGALCEIKGWLFDVEAYAKSVNNVVMISITNPESAQPFIHGMVQTIGADALMRKRWRWFSAWLSYSISQSQMDFDSVYTEVLPALNDQRHVLDLGLSATHGPWSVSLAWKWRSGLAQLQGLRPRLLYGADSAPGAGLPDPTGTPLPPAEVLRQPFDPYHQLDLSAAFSQPIFKNRTTLQIAASATNLYNQKNVISSFLVVHNGQPTVAQRTTMGRLLNLSVGFRF